MNWLCVDQAAAKLGRSPRWFYRNAKRLAIREASGRAKCCWFPGAGNDSADCRSEGLTV